MYVKLISLPCELNQDFQKGGVKIEDNRLDRNKKTVLIYQEECD